MNTQHVNGTASESSKTWLKGQKIFVSAKDLRIRLVSLGAEGESATPATGIHYPARNGYYGVDVLRPDEAEVLALIAAGNNVLLRLASSEMGMTALYDVGEVSLERYIIASHDQIFERTASLKDACIKYIRRVNEVLTEEMQVFPDYVYTALEAGRDNDRKSGVPLGLDAPLWVSYATDENQETTGSGKTSLNDIPF